MGAEKDSISRLPVLFLPVLDFDTASTIPLYRELKECYGYLIGSTKCFLGLTLKICHNLNSGLLTLRTLNSGLLTLIVLTSHGHSICGESTYCGESNPSK